MQETQPDYKLMIVRYEDLHTDTEGLLRRMLDFIEWTDVDDCAAAILPCVDSRRICTLVWCDELLCVCVCLCLCLRLWHHYDLLIVPQVPHQLHAQRDQV